MILGGTGHRPDKLGGYERDVEDCLFNVAVRYVETVHPTMGVSGMALGWDQALAKAFIALGVPFIAAVPCEGQELTWPQRSQQVYHKLLAKAAEVVLVTDGPYQSWKMHRRNEWMVDKSTRMAVLWDGSPGGTSNCMKHINRKKIAFDNLWDAYYRELTLVRGT